MNSNKLIAMFEKLRADELRIIDQLCDEFELRWSQESGDLLRACLERCPVHLQEYAFLELLRVDVELRSNRGYHVDSGNYIQLFPEFRDLIDSVLDTKGPKVETMVYVPRQVSRADQARHLSEELPADTFGRFELREQLGAGAFGTVYRAYDPTLDREVALKLPRFSDRDQDRVERFLDEAQIAARLHHPNIVSVWERGRVEDRYYISTEYVAGETLETVLAIREIPLELKVQWIRDLALALDYAHSESVIHRDLKPANVIVNRQDRPLLMDFGLAKRVDTQANRTSDGLILGTPAYMSPEQAIGIVSQISFQSDQYSLGMVFFELLTGKPRFQGTLNEVFLRLLDAPPTPDFSKASNIPVDLIAVCQQMLQPTASDRYPTCGDVARDLTHWLEGRTVSVRRVSATERLVRWCRRNPVVGSLLATIAAVLLVSLIVVSMALIEASEARMEAVQNLAVAQQAEQQANVQRDHAQAAAEAERKEVARSSLLLAGREIRAGRMQEARSLVNSIGQEHRNWIWRLHDARIPRERFRWTLPAGTSSAETRVYLDPQGKRIAVVPVSRDGATRHSSVAVFDIESGRQLLSLSEEKNPIWATSNPFGRDGRSLLVSRGDIKRVDVYDLEAGAWGESQTQVRSFRHRPGGGSEVLLQKELADNQFQYAVWNYRDGALTEVARGRSYGPYNYSVSADSTDFSFRSKGRASFLASVEENNLRLEMMSRLGAIHSNLSLDQTLVVGQLTDIWDWNRRRLVVPAGQAVVVKFPAEMVSRLESDHAVSGQLFQYAEGQMHLWPRMPAFAISTDNRFVTLNTSEQMYAIASRGELSWWNLESGEFLGKAAGLVISANADSYATIEDGDVVVREAPTRIRRFRSERLEELLAGDEPISPPFTGSNFREFYHIRYIDEDPWVISFHTDYEHRVDPSAKRVKFRAGEYKFSNAVAMDSQHKRIATYNGKKTIDLFSLETGQRTHSIPCGSNPSQCFLALHPDGKRLAGGNGDEVLIWSIETSEVLNRIQGVNLHPSYSGSLTFSATGRYMLVHEHKGKRLIFESDSWELVFEDRDNPVSTLTLSPDDSMLAVNDGAGNVQLLSFPERQIIKELTTDASMVRVAFHPHEPMLAMLRNDGRLTIWDWVTWNLLFDEPVPDADRLQLVFSDSGESLAVMVGWRWFEYSADKAE